MYYTWPVLKILQVLSSNIEAKWKKNFFFRFSIFYTFHAILNPKNEKKNFDPKFWNFKSPPNRPNLKFWNSDFASWLHTPRWTIFEKFIEQLVKATEWRAENLQKWPKITKFWLWTPVKSVWGKKSKFRFLQFLLNHIMCLYARFCWPRMKTLGALGIFPIVHGRRTPDGRTPQVPSPPQLRWA